MKIVPLFLVALTFSFLPQYGQTNESNQKPHNLILAQAGFNHSTKAKVIDFYASWCPACDQLKPEIKKAQRAYKDQLDFISVNIDDPKNRDIVRLYKVRGVPEVVFIDQEGLVVSSFMGFEKKALKVGLQKVLSKENTQIAVGTKSLTQ